jgi:Polyketide cyclase / dehydrase and lipid transport
MKNSMQDILFKTTKPLSVLAIFLAAGCASITPITTSSEKGSAMTYEVSVERKIIIKKDIESVFNFITAEDVLPKVLTGYGPLPGVTHTSEVSGPWDVANSTRIVHLADRSIVREQMLSRKPFESFSYRVWEFGNPIIATLATGANGDWKFKTVPEGTAITWKYTFKAKNALTAIPMSAITQLLWRGYMDVCLANTAKQLQ